MVDTGELESYVNSVSVKTGDIIEFRGEGTIGEITQTDGTKRKALNIPVLVNPLINGGKNLVWSPGKTALKELNRLLGRDTKTWVTKKIKVAIVKQQSFGQLKDIVIPAEMA